MSEIKVKTIEPSTGTNLTLGTSGDTVAVSSDAVKLDIWKDSGGNTLFQSDGSGTLSNVNGGLAGAGWKLISTNTVTRGTSVSSVDITSGIDSTYNHYIILLLNIEITYNGSQLQFEASSDAGSSWGITKTGVGWYGRNTAADSQSGPTLIDSIASSTNAQRFNYEQGGNDPSNETAAGEFHLFSPSSTTYVKPYYIRTSSYYVSNGNNQQFTSGYLNTTSAVNGIRFSTVQGDIYGGKFKLYGYG